MKINPSVFDNEQSAIIIAIMVAAYGVALAKYDLPSSIKKLFKNNIFRVFFLALLLIFTLDTVPHVAIAMALVFALTLHYINEWEIKEGLVWLNAYESILNE